MTNVHHLPQKEPFENGISGDEVMRRIRAAGGKATDGVIDVSVLKSGWGMACFVGRLSHYWTRVGKPMHMISKHHGIITGHRLNSDCGLYTVVDDVRPLFGEGNYGRCKKCDRSRRHGL